MTTAISREALLDSFLLPDLPELSGPAALEGSGALSACLWV